MVTSAIWVPVVSRVVRVVWPVLVVVLVMMAVWRWSVLGVRESNVPGRVRCLIWPSLDTMAIDTLAAALGSGGADGGGGEQGAVGGGGELQGLELAGGDHLLRVGAGGGVDEGHCGVRGRARPRRVGHQYGVPVGTEHQRMEAADNAHRRIH